MKINALFFCITLLTCLFLVNIPANCQNTSIPGKIKSKTVHEEKTVKGIKTTLIESEEKYDLNGNVIDEIQYKDGKIDKHIVNEYDSNNNKTKETEFDGTGKAKKTCEYKYANGLRIEKNTFDENKKLISKKTYTYSY
jgi:hypothetical protein